MTWSKFARLVFQGLRRNKSDVALASIGIIAGTAALFAFTSLGTGLSRVVLEDIFDIRQLEVIPPSVTADQTTGSGGGLAGALFGGQSSATATIEPNTVDKLADVPGVANVYPKMKLTFPASIRGGKKIIGQTLVAELIADGVPADLVDIESKAGDMAFRDWESVACGGSASCPTGYACKQGECIGHTCRSPDASCPGATYCAADTGRCQLPIPVVASKTLMEMLESNVKTALQGSSSPLANLSGLSKDALIGLEAEGIFGASYLGRAEGGEPIRRRLRLVGFSRQAIDLGGTMPLGYVQRLNDSFGDHPTEAYHSVLLELSSDAAVTRVARTVTQDLDLALTSEYQNAQRAGLVITLITLLFDAISLAILIIAAIHITHTLLMILLERRREIGLMRAVGATPRDIKWLVFGEASIIGIVAGMAGLAVGWGLTLTADWAFVAWVPEFPFKPDTLFQVPWWLPPACLATSLAFTWFGSLVPAIRAANIDPAEALTK